MLATLAPSVPANDDQWAFEMKWDGIRLLARIHDGRVQLMTRNRIDATPRYPELAALGRAAAGQSLILDGEVVGFDEAGRHTFEALQQRGALERGARRVAFMVFDVLALGGRSLLSAPYTERRAALEALALDGPHWHTPPYSRGGGAAMLQTSRDQEMEGVIAKRLDSRYEPGRRTGAWLKIKNQQRQEFVIGGWVPGAGKREGKIGALVIGYWDGEDFVSAGKVGTGFTEMRLGELAELLGPLARDSSPFGAGVVPRNTKFVEPRLVCEVEFTEWTSRTGQLRHPSFKGLRTDKASREVVREG
jgi:bifunctional non-homologous end joining protein LigD